MNDLPFGLTLSEADRRNPLWVRISDHCQGRLRDLHARLESDQTELQTAIIRGHIQFLRAMIRLGDEPPQIDG